MFSCYLFLAFLFLAVSQYSFLGNELHRTLLPTVYRTVWVVIINMLNCCSISVHCCRPLDLPNLLAARHGVRAIVRRIKCWPGLQRNILPRDFILAGYLDIYSICNAFSRLYLNAACSVYSVYLRNMQTANKQILRIVCCYALYTQRRCSQTS